MRISRRVRFESDREMPPHQFSVLARLEDAPRTNSELAEIERVSAPEHEAHDRLPRRRRATSPAPTTRLDGRQVILSLTPEGRKAVRRIRRHRDEWMLDAVRAPHRRRARRCSSRRSAVLAKVASK